MFFLFFSSVYFLQMGMCFNVFTTRSFFFYFLVSVQLFPGSVFACFCKKSECSEIVANYYFGGAYVKWSSTSSSKILYSLLYSVSRVFPLLVGMFFLSSFLFFSQFFWYRILSLSFFRCILPYLYGCCFVGWFFSFIIFSRSLLSEVDMISSNINLSSSCLSPIFQVLFSSLVCFYDLPVIFCLLALPEEVSSVDGVYFWHFVIFDFYWYFFAFNVSGWALISLFAFPSRAPEPTSQMTSFRISIFLNCSILLPQVRFKLNWKVYYQFR